MKTRRYSFLVALGVICLALQAQSCGSDSTTEQEPLDDASYGGAAGKAGAAQGGASGSKAGSGGAKGGSAGSQAGGGGSSAGSGGADAGAGKGGSAGVDAGKGGSDASAGNAGTSGSTDGGAGADGSPSDTGSTDAPADATEEADAAAVCTLQTGDSVCQTCMLANCNAQCLTCEGNPFCQAIIVCVQACGDDNCKKQCWDNNKDGQDDFNAFASQSGCLQNHCATECPGLPDTGGCSVSANRKGDAGWLLLAAMIGLARVFTRRREER
ncbi:MAG: hypothetical protein HY898_00335 [Deltaproteobacteria bacterium]|nr:hypothetical protein [Deltaproteobacteria bacterium]